jgi:site-specific recombinase XerD
MPKFIPNNKGQKFPIELLTPEEMARLSKRMVTTNSGAKTRGPCAVRDAALMYVLDQTGMRISEALGKDKSATLPALPGLRVGNIEKSRTHLVVVSSAKTRKPRRLAIDASSNTPLGRWLTMRNTLHLPRSAPVFCLIQKGLVGNRMGDVQLRSKMKEKARQAGITKRVHPHGLRHGAAHRWATEGVSLPEISRRMGHGDIACTVRYLKGVMRNTVLIEVDEHGDEIEEESVQSIAGACASARLEEVLAKLMAGTISHESATVAMAIIERIHEAERDHGNTEG